MDSRIALAFQAPDIAGNYQNALANQQKIEAAKMQNALAAQEMADIKAAREFEKSPEGVKQRGLKKKSDDQKAAAEDIKNFLPMATPENWGSFGQYMGERYGNPGVFGGAYDEAAHRKMMENFGIVKPQKEVSPFTFINTGGGIGIGNERTGELDFIEVYNSQKGQAQPFGLQPNDPIYGIRDEKERDKAIARRIASTEKELTEFDDAAQSAMATADSAKRFMGAY